MNSDINFAFFNIGTNISTSINFLAEIINAISNKDLKIINVEALEGDVRNSLADITNAKEKLNWIAKIKLQEGLKRFFEK